MPTPSFYLVRVTTEDHKFVCEKLLKNKKTICCSEVGKSTEKPHVHFILFESKSTVWRRLQQAGYIGNQAFAFTDGKEGDENVQNALRYICKGEGPDENPNIIFNTMDISDEQIKKYHDEYWFHVDNCNEDNDNKVNDKLRKRKYGDVEKSNAFKKKLQYCKQKGISVTSNGWEIASVLFDFYSEKQICEPLDIQIKVLAKSIQRQLVFEAYHEKNPSKWELYKSLRGKDIIGNEWLHSSQFI